MQPPFDVNLNHRTLATYVARDLEIFRIRQNHAVCFEYGNEVDQCAHLWKTQISTRDRLFPEKL